MPADFWGNSANLNGLDVKGLGVTNNSEGSHFAWGNCHHVSHLSRIDTAFSPNFRIQNHTFLKDPTSHSLLSFHLNIFWHVGFLVLNKLRLAMDI